MQSIDESSNSVACRLLVITIAALHCGLLFLVHEEHLEVILPDKIGSCCLKSDAKLSSTSGLNNVLCVSNYHHH